MFAARTYTPESDYYLVISSNDVETDRIAFKVDIAITNDLGVMEDIMDEIDTKLNQVFPGRVVRKDPTKKIKNVKCACVRTGVFARDVLRNR